MLKVLNEKKMKKNILLIISLSIFILNLIGSDKTVADTKTSSVSNSNKTRKRKSETDSGPASKRRVGQQREIIEVREDKEDKETAIATPTIAPTQSGQIPDVFKDSAIFTDVAVDEKTDPEQDRKDKYFDECAAKVKETLKDYDKHSYAKDVAEIYKIKKLYTDLFVCAIENLTDENVIDNIERLLTSREANSPWSGSGISIRTLSEQDKFFGVPSILTIALKARRSPYVIKAMLDKGLNPNKWAHGGIANLLKLAEYDEKVQELLIRAHRNNPIR